MDAADPNPQAEQMAHESMLRTLAAQADLIWPQERELLARHRLPADSRVLDVGCGSGEAALRLAAEWESARVLGLDVHAPHLELARERAARFGERVRFELGDAFELELPDSSFELVLCRHVLQAIPRAERVVEELARVCAPGGVVHLLAEDYGMMHFAPTRHDCDRFWHDGPVRFARSTGTDLLVGRRAPALLRAAGLSDVRLDYVVVDTLRCPRARFADVWRAWRDGYASAIAAHTDFELEEVLARFDDMIGAIESEEGYGVWHVPVASGRKPA